MGLTLYPVENFHSLTGKDLKGTIDGKMVLIVSPGYVNELKLEYDNVQFDERPSAGKTVVFTIIDGKLAGMIALADIVRETAIEAIKKHKEMNIKSIMPTGENLKVAHYIGKQLGMEEIYAEVLPHEKSEKIDHIRKVEGL